MSQGANSPGTLFQLRQAGCQRRSHGAAHDDGQDARQCRWSSGGDASTSPTMAAELWAQAKPALNRKRPGSKPTPQVRARAPSCPLLGRRLCDGPFATARLLQASYYPACRCSLVMRAKACGSLFCPSPAARGLNRCLRLNNASACDTLRCSRFLCEFRAHPPGKHRCTVHTLRWSPQPSGMRKQVAGAHRANLPVPASTVLPGRPLACVREACLSAAA